MMTMKPVETVAPQLVVQPLCSAPHAPAVDGTATPPGPIAQWQGQALSIRRKEVDFDDREEA